MEKLAVLLMYCMNSKYMDELAEILMYFMNSR